MSAYFLAVRFPLALLGDDCLERIQDAPPVHEEEGHVFYQTDLQVVAEKLLDLFKRDKPDISALNASAPTRELVETVRRDESVDMCPTPVFEVVSGCDLALTERVRYREEVQQLADIAPVSFLKPEGLALLGLNHDRRTVLLVRHYEQARRWDPLVRDELDVPSSSARGDDGRADEAAGVTETGNAKTTQQRVWIWALRPLEHDHSPNMCCFIDDAPGRVVQMLYSERTGAAIPARHSPGGDGWKVWYRYYRPTNKDIAVLKAAYPDDDPRDPNWLNVKRDLVCARHDAEALTKAEVPVLLGLLAELKVVPAKPLAEPTLPRTFGDLLKPVESSECAYRQSIAEAEAFQRRGHRAGIGGLDSGGPKGEGADVRRGDRRSLSADDEAKVLEKCRRRCCVCFMLDRDLSEKKGQLAHLDHNRYNNAISNFVFLCLPHHDTYDSKTSQAKNLTEREVRLYQAKLHEAVERGEVPHAQAPAVLKFPAQEGGPLNIKGDGNVVAGGDVNYVVNMPKARRGKGRSASTKPPIIPGTVSEDARMVGYLNYLVRRYEKFKKWECVRSGRRMGWGVIRNAYKRDMKYELIHTPKTLFEAGARYLQQRIENTRVGKMKRGQKLYSTFDDFDEQANNDEDLLS